MTGVLTIGLGGLAGAMIAVAATWRWPKQAVWGFVVVVAFLPIWVGVAAGLYFPAVTLVGVVLVTGLAIRGLPRWSVTDLVVAFVFAAALMGPMLGAYSLTGVVDVLTYWIVGYLAGRLALTHVDAPDVYLALGVVFAVVGAVAMLEYAMDWHPLAELGPGTSLHQFWATIQTRGGLSRSEGAFGHSIALAVSLALSAVVAVEARAPVAVRILMIAVMAGGIAVTLSRLGLVCLVLGLVGCLVFLRGPQWRTMRQALLLALAAGVIIVTPFVMRVLTLAGSEATDSSSYRGDLLEILPRVPIIGATDALQRSPYGNVFYGGYRSIDSELLLMGLLYGWVVVVLFAALLVLLGFQVMTGRATSPAIAVLAHVPALATVALITQYHLFFWFVVGLAVASTQLRRSPTLTRDRELQDAIVAGRDQRGTRGDAG